MDGNPIATKRINDVTKHADWKSEELDSSMYTARVECDKLVGFGTGHRECSFCIRADFRKTILAIPGADSGTSKIVLPPPPPIALVIHFTSGDRFFSLKTGVR